MRMNWGISAPVSVGFVISVVQNPWRRRAWGERGGGCPSRPLYVRKRVPRAGRLLASATPRRPTSPLGDSLTVELPALDRTAQVRILVPQPSPRTLSLTYLDPKARTEGE